MGVRAGKFYSYGYCYKTLQLQLQLDATKSLHAVPALPMGVLPINSLPSRPKLAVHKGYEWLCVPPIGCSTNGALHNYHRAAYMRHGTCMDHLGSKGRETSVC